MTATTEAWTEFCLIGIKSENDANEVQFAALTEDITAMDWGEKDIEGMPLVNGGRVTKKVPMTDSSVTMKVYPVSVAKDGTGVWPYLAGTSDNSDPFSVLVANTRERHRLVFLWADPLPATASAAVPASQEGYRITVANAYCTKVVPSFDDKIVSAEITFKWVPFTKAAVANHLEESTEAVGLNAVTATATDVTAT